MTNKTLSLDVRECHILVYIKYLFILSIYIILGFFTVVSKSSSVWLLLECMALIKLASY